MATSNQSTTVSRGWQTWQVYLVAALMAVIFAYWPQIFRATGNDTFAIVPFVIAIIAAGVVITYSRDDLKKTFSWLGNVIASTAVALFALVIVKALFGADISSLVSKGGLPALITNPNIITHEVLLSVITMVIALCVFHLYWKTPAERVAKKSRKNWTVTILSILLMYLCWDSYTSSLPEEHRIRRQQENALLAEGADLATGAFKYSASWQLHRFSDRWRVRATLPGKEMVTQDAPLWQVVAGDFVLAGKDLPKGTKVFPDYNRPYFHPVTNIPYTLVKLAETDDPTDVYYIRTDFLASKVHLGERKPAMSRASDFIMNRDTLIVVLALLSIVCLYLLFRPAGAGPKRSQLIAALVTIGLLFAYLSGQTPSLARAGASKMAPTSPKPTLAKQTAQLPIRAMDDELKVGLEWVNSALAPENGEVITITGFATAADVEHLRVRIGPAPVRSLTPLEQDGGGYYAQFKVNPGVNPFLNPFKLKVIDGEPLVLTVKTITMK